MNLKEKINKSEKLKKLILYLLSSNNRPKPRMITKLFINPFFHTKGRGAIIVKRGSRIDVFPWHRFDVGEKSIIEGQCIINNGAGDVIIGKNTLIGIGSIITGPVTIGNNILFGQRVFISGFNHGYQDTKAIIKDQPLDKHHSSVGDDTFIGTNATIIAGVNIGKRCQIGAGSVVTKDIPDYCVAVGNPAKVVKKFDNITQTWISING